MSRILVIDDDTASCRTLQLHFQSGGHQVSLAHDLEAGIANAAEVAPDLIVLDIRMPGRDGLEGLREFKQRQPETPVIMITAFHDMDTTIQAMKNGADDYIDKPIDIDELDRAVADALARAHSSENGVARMPFEDAKPGTNIMVGRSRAMKAVFKTIGLAAPSGSLVLVTGESGTGKELVARAIHYAGTSPAGPFVAVNCAALVETLLESDLFGHEKGAFTGATSRHMGKFAVADKGSIFLDEIGDMSLPVQAKLLRVLQEKEYIPLGSHQVQTTNARVIAATNCDLKERVEAGAFREDLYYRLQVVTIYVPPLRSRKEDLDDLVPVILSRIQREMQRRKSGVALDVMDAFRAYDWPGNVRELENVLMKAVALCPGDVITQDFIPERIRGTPRPAGVAAKPMVERSLSEVECEHVERVLNATGWHRGHACDILQVSRPRLRRLIQQYGLTPPATDLGDDSR